MNCKHCNAELEEGMKFCPVCGAALAEAETSAAQETPVVEEPTVTEETPTVEETPVVEAAPTVEETPVKKGLGAGKIALLVILAVAAIAVIAMLIMGGKGGNTPEETTLRDVMSRCVITCEATDTLESAVKKMEDAQIRRLPVTENGRPAGMLTLGDIAKRKDCKQQAAHALSEISSNLHKLS